MKKSCGPACPDDYSGDLVFFFENGKAARVALSAYQTQTRRKKLIGAFSDKSPVVKVLWLKEDQDLAVGADSGKTVLFDSSLLAAKSTRAAQGVGVLTLKKGQKLAWAAMVGETHDQAHRPVSGAEHPGRGGQPHWRGYGDRSIAPEGPSAWAALFLPGSSE